MPWSFSVGFPGNKEFDQIATVLLSNPMFLAGSIGCFLDNLIPGKYFLIKRFPLFLVAKKKDMYNKKINVYMYIRKNYIHVH